MWADESRRIPPDNVVAEHHVLYAKDGTALVAITRHGQGWTVQAVGPNNKGRVDFRLNQAYTLDKVKQESESLLRDLGWTTVQVAPPTQAPRP